MDGWIQVPANSALTFQTNDFSVSFWFRTTDTEAYIVEERIQNPTKGWLFQLWGTPLLGPSFYLENGYIPEILAACPQTAQYQDGNWHAMTGIRAGSSIYLYIDGQMVSQAGGRLVDVGESQQMEFGKPYVVTDPSQWYSGDLDELRIYNRALSAAEVQALYNVASGQPSLSNVRASQRAGTNLVNVWYDLSGATAPVFVSVSISTDGGVTYALQPAHLTGDGVTTPVGSRSGLHLVWDAGADWPGRYSTQTRVLVSVPPGGGNAQANSPMFTVDSRGVLTGTITGLVVGNSSPVAGAQVQLEGMLYGTNTTGDGSFTLGGVPVNLGYVVTVAASGFVPCRLTGVNVAAGTNNLGNVVLQAGCGSYRLASLVPDVNPTNTIVEDGGTAYRYYCVLDCTNGVQGGVSVGYRFLGAALSFRPMMLTLFGRGRLRAFLMYMGLCA